MEFSRRLRELVAGEQQREIANKLGYTASRISQILRGEKPSREFVERVIEAYEVDRELWLGYAGYGAVARATDPTEAVASAVVRQLLEQGYVSAPPSTSGRASRVQDSPSPYEALMGGIEALVQEFGRPIPMSFDHSFFAGLTHEGVERQLAELRRQLEAGEI